MRSGGAAADLPNNSLSSIAQRKETGQPVQRFAPTNKKQGGESKTGSNISGHSDSPIQRKLIIKTEGPAPVTEEIKESDIPALGRSAEVNTIIKAWVKGREEKVFKDQVTMFIAAYKKLHRPESNVYDGTLASLARELRVGAPTYLDDASLLDILKRPFESNWFKAKACLAMGQWPSGIVTESKPAPSHEACLHLMQSLVDMRGREWKKFYDTNLPLAKTTLGDDTLEIPEPDGSQSVTSDLDLSIKGKKSEAAVTFFNKKFKEVFAVPFEPGTVFDINMYSLDWMHGPVETLEAGGTPDNRTAIITPQKEANLPDLGVEDLKKKAAGQEHWSYVKIMRNMSGTQIGEYKTQVLAAFTPASPEHVAMGKKLDAAELQTATFKAEVAAKATSMLTKFNEDKRVVGLIKSRSAFKDAADEHNSADHYDKQALEMRASNAIYQAKVQEVKALRVRIEKLKATPAVVDEEAKSIENLSLELANKIAEALTYANEVYASEGAVLHTVYGKQKAKKKKEEYAKTEGKKHIKDVKIALSPDQYMQSLNENVGDSLHSLTHFEHLPQYAVFRAGKYLDRMCDAADALFLAKAGELTHYAALRKLGTKAAEEKDKELGKDPLKANTHETFKVFNNGSKLSALKGQIITFGATATAAFHKPKPAPAPEL